MHLFDPPLFSTHSSSRLSGAALTSELEAAIQQENRIRIR